MFKRQFHYQFDINANTSIFSNTTDMTPQKVKANLLDITAQDLLGKSHEELVLILIHLRRQSAALTEAIDSSKNELSQLRKMPPNAPQHPSILGGSSDGSGNGENSSLDQHKV